MTTQLTTTDAAAESERPARGRLKRLVLGRPSDPRWARPALWAVLILAAMLYSWDLGRNGDANTFYAAAVLSGTESWKAFFYGSLDSASFITVDKPPFAFWVMEISAADLRVQQLEPAAAPGRGRRRRGRRRVRRRAAQRRGPARGTRGVRGGADRRACPHLDPDGGGDRQGRQSRHDADAAADTRRVGAAGVAAGRAEQTGRTARPHRPGAPAALADPERSRVRARVQHQDARGVHRAARAADRVPDRVRYPTAHADRAAVDRRRRAGRDHAVLDDHRRPYPQDEPSLCRKQRQRHRLESRRRVQRLRPD